MNRRNFLGTLFGGVVLAAASQTFPFKVYSFPTEVKLFEPAEIAGWVKYRFHYTVTLPPEGTNRIRYIDSYPSVL